MRSSELFLKDLQVLVQSTQVPVSWLLRDR
jgi:hypothetical protein